MPVTGDFAKLEKLKASLQRTLKVPQKTAVAFAPELSTLVQAEFATGTDPWGDPWKALKLNTLKKGRTPPPLTATGVARDSATVAATGTKDRVQMANYLRYHLTSRPVLPLRGDVWPSKWIEAIRTKAAGIIADIASGKVS